MTEPSGRFDRSFADLMAGVAVVFLLMAVMFIRKVNAEKEKVKQDLSKATQRIDKSQERREKVHKSIAELREKLQALNERVNKELGGNFINVEAGEYALEVEFEELQFGRGRCTVPRTYANKLEGGAAQLVGTICDAVKAISDAGAKATIGLEGHTDNEPFVGKSAECGVTQSSAHLSFENNVRASAARAQSVFLSIRNALPEGSDARQCLDDNFVVSGRGEAAPIDKTHPEDERNRRLVIRVRGDLGLQEEL